MVRCQDPFFLVLNLLRFDVLMTAPFMKNWPIKTPNGLQVDQSTRGIEVGYQGVGDRVIAVSILFLPSSRSDSLEDRIFGSLTNQSGSSVRARALLKGLWEKSGPEERIEPASSCTSRTPWRTTSSTCWLLRCSTPVKWFSSSNRPLPSNSTRLQRPWS